MATRSPICVVVGHVDHGKSSVLDYIRNTNIVKSEAGAITQAIGASIIPIQTIKQKCGSLLEAFKVNFTIPGLLFIDTPGHAAFTSLRKRGGSLAEIAILVVDINEGFMPQTIESIKILKESKTPFIVAANKIDKLSGYRRQSQTQISSVLANISKHDEKFQQLFETKMYELVGNLHEQGFASERFDRVTDFTKEVGIVPVSAMFGDGMAELLVVMSALAQKYLEKNLQTNIDGPAKGSILEVKEVQGVGTVLDTIIYDGTISVGDIIVIGDLHEPIVTKVKCLFVPTTQTDMRDKKSKFSSIKSVQAATGVRINGPNIERVMSGMPIAVATEENIEQVQAQINQEISEIGFSLDDKGIIVKADTIGSLEAIMHLLKEKNVPVRIASVGEISKKDVVEAQANLETDPKHAVIVGFNLKVPKDIPKEINCIVEPVVYKIIDRFVEWRDLKESEEKKQIVSTLPEVGKCKFLEGCAFRQSGPAIFGIEVMRGKIKQNMVLMKKDLSRVGVIKSLQENKQNCKEATQGQQLACSIEGVTIGRQIHENDIYYTQISEDDYLRLKEYKDLLSQEQKELLLEIAEVYRKQNPAWGVGD